MGGQTVSALQAARLDALKQAVQKMRRSEAGGGEGGDADAMDADGSLSGGGEESGGDEAMPEADASGEDEPGSVEGAPASGGQGVKLLSFHNRTADAAVFAELLQSQPGFTAWFVSGEMAVDERKEILKRFTRDKTGDVCVICSCKALQEGV